jgi:hypothetical protein
MSALSAKRITGEEATQVEAALHRGVAPHREILERIFEGPLGKSLVGNGSASSVAVRRSWMVTPLPPTRRFSMPHRAS